MPFIHKPKKRKKQKLFAHNTIQDEQHFKSVNSDESRLQAQCEEWLEICKIPYLHIPNCAFEGKRKVASKYLKGWPDFIIFTIDENYNRALFIELKIKKGKTTQGQENRAKNLQLNIVRSLDDFILKVERFLNEY